MDCELVRDGLVAEPVNALSSLAYVAAGFWVVGRDRLRGLALVAVGIGSVAYHAAGGFVTSLLHNVTIAALAVALVPVVLRIALGARDRPFISAMPVILFAFAIPLQVYGRTDGALCDPDALVQPHAGWHALTAAAIGIAVTLGTLERRAIVSDRA